MTKVLHLDFWLVERNVFQTPNVTFMNQILLEVFFESDSLYWSSVSNYKSNYILNSKYVYCYTTYSEIKTFKNNIVLGEIVNEGLDINISIPTSNKKVNGIRAFVIFDYKLQNTFMFQTQALVNFEKIFSVSGSQLIAYGKLKFFQKLPLPYGSHYNYSTNIIPTNTVTEPHLIMLNYQKRNFTVSLDQDSSMFSWTPVFGSTPSTFNLLLRIRYAPQYIRYISTFWYSLKFAWLQYLSLMFIFYLFFDRVRFYLFSKRLLATTIVHPTPMKSNNEFT